MNNIIVKIFSIIIVVSIVLSNFTYAKNDIPDDIRVGLEYYHLNKQKIGISSIELEIGKLKNDDVRKETILNSNFGFEIATDNKYYIQMGKAYDDYDDALNDSKDIKSNNYRLYLDEDGDWYIYVGGFYSKQDRDNAYNSVKNENKNFDVKKIDVSVDRVEILNKSTNTYISFHENIGFKSKDDKLKLVKRTYRGVIQFIRNTSGYITPVNTVDFEDYLKGVVPAEMSAGWHIEALKAQAVAARNYAILQIEKHKYVSYDICDKTTDQVYVGCGIESEDTNKAVEDTKGELLFYKDELVETFYHATSGGYTEDSINVWGGDIPYLQGVEDKYEKNARYETWTEVISKSSIKNGLNKIGVDIGSVKNLEILKNTSSGRVLELKINGTKGHYVLSKEKIRYFFSNVTGSILKSRMFEIQGTVKGNMYVIGLDGKKVKIGSNQSIYVCGADGKVVKKQTGSNSIYVANNDKNVKAYVQTTSNANDKNVVLNGRGWGHGIGMSQYGAKGMAEAGLSYEDILTHYYTNTKIVK